MKQRARHLKIRGTLGTLGLALALAGCGSTVTLGSSGASSGTGLDSLGQPITAPDTLASVPTAIAGISTPDQQAAGANDTSAGSQDSATTDPNYVAPASVVAAPLELGLFESRNQSALAASFGVSSGGITVEKVQDALVAWYNSHGGIAGHKIATVKAPIDATAASYETAYQAACASFTQDHHVVAVLDDYQYISAAFEECSTKAKLTHIRASGSFLDQRSAATHPQLFTIGGVSVDRRLSLLIDKLTATGYLTKRNKIAVLVSGCSYNDAGYAHALVPALKRHGLSITQKEEGKCTTGTSNAGPAAANAAHSVLAFKAAGIDRVMFVTDQEDVGFLLFSEAAESQGYRPGYMLTSLSTPALLTGTIPAQQLKTVQGVGWAPASDVTTGKQPSAGPSAKQCVSMLSKQGLKAASPADTSIMYSVCSAFFVLERGALGTSPLTGAAIGRAVEALGSAVSAPAVLLADTNFSPTRHDGPASTAVFAYATSCTCFSYITQPTRD